MAGGVEQFLLEGGMSQPQLAAVASGNYGIVAGGGMQPHHSVLGVVLLAIVGLYVLDRLGFRFAVSTGRR